MPDTPKYSITRKTEDDSAYSHRFPESEFTQEIMQPTRIAWTDENGEYHEIQTETEEPKDD